VHRSPCYEAGQGFLSMLTSGQQPSVSLVGRLALRFFSIAVSRFSFLSFGSRSDEPGNTREHFSGLGLPSGFPLPGFVLLWF